MGPPSTPRPRGIFADPSLGIHFARLAWIARDADLAGSCAWLVLESNFDTPAPTRGPRHSSLKALNPADAKHGNGQYLSDIVLGTKTPAQLSREFLGMPFQGSRFTHYVEIDVSGLNVVQGRPGVFLIPNEGPLDLAGRIVGSGRMP